MRGCLWSEQLPFEETKGKFLSLEEFLVSRVSYDEKWVYQ
jgi:hypothetical protein